MMTNAFSLCDTVVKLIVLSGLENYHSIFHNTWSNSFTVSKQ